MKILIIEDEFRNYNRLRKMLLAYDPGLTIEGPIESVAEARQWLSAHRGGSASGQSGNAPDLVLADIRLGDGLSFDALGELDDASSLVFTTAYDEYALQAFQYNSLAYLMKPIEEDELRQTLDRVGRLRGKDPQTGMPALLAQMREGGYQYRERFLVPYKDGFEVVNVRDVAFACTEFKDTRLYLAKHARLIQNMARRFYSIPMSLEEMEAQLDPRSFFRVNRQFIVNVSAVEGLKTYFGGKLRVRLSGYEEMEVMCSRDKAAALKEWLNR